MIQQDRHPAHFDIQDEPINGLINARPRLWSNMMGLIVVMVAKKSKSCQKVEKTSKTWKICKDHRFGGTKLFDLRH